jgi:hypothetical protein
LVEEDWLLADIANPSAEFPQMKSLQVLSINTNLASFRIVKALNKLNDSTFSGSRSANDGCGLTLLEGSSEII